MPNSIHLFGGTFLHVVPVCIMSSTCSGDGTRCRTNQSKLKDVLLVVVRSLGKAVLVSFPKDVLLADLIALINTLVSNLPSTYQEFLKILMQQTP